MGSWLNVLKIKEKTKNMTKSQWRLIPLLETDGKTQMNIDRWLLHQHYKENYPPTLRFYTWFPAAISLGYHQKRFPSAWQNLTWNGKNIDLVYRPTGGRAVLHQGDLTYMVVTSGLKGNRKQVYEEICQFLIDGWQKLGIELHYGKAGRNYIHNANCFATSTGADLINNEGQKLIGSAQLIKKEAILQHGSMILKPDKNLYTKVFGKSPNIKNDFPSNEAIIKQLIKTAKECFNCEFFEQPLTNQELKEIYQNSFSGIL